MGPGKLFPRGETLDISLAKKELGFSPRYRMEEAVAEYAEWVKKVKSTKNHKPGLCPVAEIEGWQSY